MKKRLVFFLGILCSLAIVSCSKDAVPEPEQATELLSHKRPPAGNFFDPYWLVSHAARGKLDTIQKGFSFTEGPAVDRWGNVFFTDQPNDKIYRWDANTGRITLFLEG